MSFSCNSLLSSNIVLMLLGLLKANEYSEKLFKKAIKVPVLTLADIISVHNVHSQLECSFNCLKEPSCVGFKYKYGTNSPAVNCKLSSTTGKNNMEIYDDQGWVFFIDVQNNPLKNSTKNTTTFISSIGCKNAMPLGMENGTIRDNQITASSEYGSFYSASNGRLNNNGTIGVWSAKKNNGNQWLQVDFQRSTIITGISTQGRVSYHNQHVKNYTISFTVDGAKFHNYKLNGIHKIFQGNSDGNSIVNHIFTPSIVAEFIRVEPIAWNDHISMRAEFYGCYY